MSPCANLSLLPPHREVSQPCLQTKPALLPTEWVPLTWGQSQPEDGLCTGPKGKANKWAFLSNAGGILKEIEDLVKVAIHMPLRSEWWFHIFFRHVVLEDGKELLPLVTFESPAEGRHCLPKGKIVALLQFWPHCQASADSTAGTTYQLLLLVLSPSRS